MIHLDRASDIALTDQIVTQLAGLVQDGQLPPGTRLPSIRKLAATLAVSAATVVGAYDRLAARGLIEARAASGYFVSARRAALPLPVAALPVGPGLDAIALMRGMLERRPGVAHVGSGFLPESWLEDMLSARLLARVARKGVKAYARPGTPAGYAPLRQQIALQLGFAGIAAAPDQVLLTFGATHGTEILGRALLAPGDVVAVEEPGYFALFAQLRGMGAKLVAVPRTANGPDLDVLAGVCDTFRPKLLFTQTLLHNPTGSSTDAATAFRMLDLARRYDFRIVEDDVYGDLHPVANPLRLAQADRLERVILLGSYSKVLSPSIRVGYMAAPPALIPLFLEQKLLGVLSTSEFDERLVYELLASGAYRKH
ncbi:MAG: PLP-dependent aminotransferase family protein, partial [Rhodocyclaceae bacterium]|nr:PLP-dependent aminotransferase family protein [Rhodocyclaceae bacterium]